MFAIFAMRASVRTWAAHESGSRWRADVTCTVRSWNVVSPGEGALLAAAAGAAARAITSGRSARRIPSGYRTSGGLEARLSGMVVVAALLLLVFHVGPRSWVLALLAAAIVFELAEKGLLIRYTRRIPVAAGAEAMIGRPVTVISACRPAGRVRLGAESWKARCAEGAGVGERLVVAAVEESMTLVVSTPGS